MEEKIKNPMEKILYIDCFSGISGDMFLGALLDFENKNITIDFLKDELKKIDISGYEINSYKIKVNSISATKFEVNITYKQPHRSYKDIKRLIYNSSLNEDTKKLSNDIFFEIAKAESKIHGVPIENVHFHEIGAVDSIIDIVGISIILNKLEIKEFYGSKIPLGQGFVNTGHGVIPVPAPATLEILSGLPVYQGNFNFEVTTPTGASVIKTLVKNLNNFSDMPQMIINAVGYGAGSKTENKGEHKEESQEHKGESHEHKEEKHEHKGESHKNIPNSHKNILNINSNIPNLLRLIEGFKIKQKNENEFDLNNSFLLDSLILVSTNIDNTSSEIIGYMFEKLFINGVLDVWVEPILMKKNRQAFKLCALCEKEVLNDLLKIVFKQTNTLGVRTQKIDRLSLKREIKTVNLPYGEAKVKVGYLDNEIITVSPEFESCKKLASVTKKPLKSIYNDLIFFFSKK